MVTLPTGDLEPWLYVSSQRVGWKSCQRFGRNKGVKQSTLREELVHRDAHDGDADAEVHGQLVAEQRGAEDARHQRRERAGVLFEDRVGVPKPYNRRLYAREAC